jgi:2-keto-4-pentenoate hydratase/2-oxohepta-3-ene-1,7-dioic acid hydratase in catechol pathway
MITIEEQFPLIYIQLDGTQTIDDLKVYFNSFSRWLSRQEKFGLIIDQTKPEEAAKNETKEMRQFEAQWFKEHKPQISMYCCGIAIVMHSEEMLKKWQPVAAKAFLNMAGCPGQVFGTIVLAQEWINSQLKV